MKYTMTCDKDHEPVTMTVEADNDDEAMSQMMDQCKAHFGEKHPDMAKTDEEMKEMIMGMWHKEEGGGEAMGGDMPAGGQM